ncbi:MAG TPA: amino acid ABC transporter substrate-binding protein [Stellaceae bacterium]|jgi:branched-chain amino acid transport system substrate-binding protein|nr:amino acid ABC transporter substrate-binding protein [Stellaceae bacterium]
MRNWFVWLAGAAMLLAGGVGEAQAQAPSGEPIKIGFGMALTGGLAGAGKQALLAIQIWGDEVNAKGGIMGRPVKLIYYDDQSNPATVPGLFTKLLDIDKVDIVVGDYGTNLLAPAMPIVIQHKMTFFGLFGLDVNREFHYDRYFSMVPTGGPDPSASFSTGFFEIAAAQNPKPKTVAIVAADAEFPKNASDGARRNAKKAGLEIVYDKTYPPTTTDFSPIIRAINAANPDIVFSASYPPDAVGMVRAANEIGLNAKLFGGGLVGLQYANFKKQLGPQLNGIVDYDFWEPAPTLKFAGVDDFLKKYQEKASGAGVDPLGYYLAPFAYANMQVVQQTIEGAKSLDQEKLAAFARSNTFKTIEGDIKYGPNGEWAEPRVLTVQYHGVQGDDLAQWQNDSRQTILWPKEYATGKMNYPYADAKKAK